MLFRSIRQDGVSVFDQPGGSVSAYVLEQGDHPLVLEQGDWARIHDGQYVASSQLSVKGVARKRQPSIWQ